MKFITIAGIPTSLNLFSDVQYINIAIKSNTAKYMIETNTLCSVINLAAACKNNANSRKGKAIRNNRK